MGVPRFFRWLTERYPLTLEFVINNTCEPDKDWDRTSESKHNPAGALPVTYEEYDNLYIDTNGIIHRCIHEANGVLSFEDTAADLIKCVSKLVAIVRPKKLLYIAIDGVAPRSKMNQQRSRRFKADTEYSNESAGGGDTDEDDNEGNSSSNNSLEKETTLKFNKNAISPGTEFMEEMGRALESFIAMKQSEDPAWQQLCIVYSGHNVPGEGEHKITDFIRMLKARKDGTYDPETSHCVYSPDADMILLGLALHEKYVSVIREETISREAIKKRGDRQGLPNKFQIIHLGMLREYLELEFRPAFEKSKKCRTVFDINRVVDDIIGAMCFVGNDFLPGMPDVRIEDNGLDTMFSVYKGCVGGSSSTDGYLTEEGGCAINVKAFSNFLRRLTKSLTDVSIGDALRKLDEDECNDCGGGSNCGGSSSSDGLGDEYFCAIGNESGDDNGEEEEDFHICGGDDGGESCDNYDDDDDDNNDDDDDDDIAELMGYNPSTETEEATDAQGKDASKKHRDPESAYRDAYYVEKFGPENGLHNTEFHTQLVRDYMDGVVWTMRYYHEGCPSWEWFYPYHYAPFLNEIISHAKNWAVSKSFAKSAPFLPFQQLLAILPAQSCGLVPETYRWLMLDPASPIHDFYPRAFETDQNGKLREWESVVLIPFVDTKRLLSAAELAEKRMPLTPKEAARNAHGKPLLFTHTREALGTRQSPVPNAVPLVFEVHSQAKEISDGFEEVWSVVAAQRRKGSCGCTEHYSPSLFGEECIKYSASLMLSGVKLHIYQTRGQSCTLHVEDSNDSVPLEDAAKDLVGKEVYYNWPYLWAGRVRAVYDECSVARMDEDGKTIKVEKVAKAGQLMYQMKKFKKAFEENSAITFDESHIIVEIAPMQSMTMRDNAIDADGTCSCAKEYRNYTAFVPRCLVLKERCKKDPRFNMTRCPLCTHGRPVLTWEKTGEDGKVRLGVGCIENTNSNTATVVLKETVIKAGNQFAGTKEGDEAGCKWYSAKEALEQVQCSEVALEKVVDYIIFSPGHFNLGFGVYNRFRELYNPKVCHYNKAEGAVEYSEALVKALVGYRAAFPSVFEAIGERKKVGRTAWLAESQEEAMVVGEAADKWVAKLHFGSRMISTTSEVLSPAQIAAVQKEDAEAGKTVWGPSVEKKVQLSGGDGNSTVIFGLPEGLPFKVLREEKICGGTAPGDKVVNVVDDGIVPFGAVGTVVSASKADIEVVFDRPFFGGSDFDGACRSYTGAQRKVWDVLNLSAICRK